MHDRGTLRERMADLVECMRVRPLLQPLLDGELDEARRRRVLAHVEACERCGLSARAFRELKNALAQQRRPDPDAVTRLEAFVHRIEEAGAPPEGDSGPGSQVRPDEP